MRDRRQRAWGGGLVALVGCVAGLVVPAGTAEAQSPIGTTVDVDVLGTNIHLELRIGPSRQPVQPGPSGLPPAPTAPPPRASFDDRMAGITRSVPDFAGVFLNERTQTLYVRMQGGLGRAAASVGGRPPSIERAVRLVANRFQVRMRHVKVLGARYDFRQLNRWHRRMRRLFRITGVVNTGIDEQRNRLKVKVSTRSARRAVVRRLRRLRIPRRAVRITRGRVPRAQQTLQSRVRPMVGGQQISRGPFLCTLGIFGYSWRLSRWGFITNSHCTHFMGGVEGTRLYQHNPSGRAFQGWSGTDINDVGTEVDDPPWNGSCWSGLSKYRCRYSDSAFIALPWWMDPDQRSAPLNTWQYWDRTWTHGAIALPSSANGAMNYAGWSGSSTGAFPVGARWIIGIDHYPLDGANVNKVGRTTGWTAGQVTDTCDNVLTYRAAENIKVVVICSWESTLSGAGGDSGAPVFYGVPPYGEVILAGLLFAEGGFFSPIGQIEKDLGLLYLCRSHRQTDSC